MSAPMHEGPSPQGGVWSAWVQRVLGVLSPPGSFSIAILIYLGALLMLRLVLFPGASEDDAETLLLAQSFEGGYKTGQPPLYIWLAYGLTQVLGPMLPVVVALKFACLAIVYIFVHRIAQLFTGDGRWAALAGLSVLGIYYVSWDSVLNYSQTVLLAALSVIFLYILLARIAAAEAPGKGAYIWLGLIAGVGILTKYNFAILLVAAIGAALCDRDLRTKLMSARGFVSTLVATAIVVPHVLWLVGSQGLSSDMARAVPEAGDAFLSRFSGLLDMAEAVVSVLSPLLVLVIVFFPRAALPIRTIPDDNRRWARFCERGFWLLVILLAAMVLVSGMSEVRNHWFLVLVSFPAYAVLRISQAYPLGVGVSKRLAAYTSVLLFLGAAVAVGLTARAMTLPERCGKCKMVVPYKQLATGLKEAGFQTGTIYVHDYPTQVGGNLRRFFPESRFVSFKFDSYVPPERVGSDSQCLAVWLLGAEGQSPDQEAVIGALQQRFDVAATPGDALKTVDVNLPGRTEPLRYGYILIDDIERQGGCR